MVEVKKSKDGRIEELSDIVTVQEKYGGGSKQITIPKELADYLNLTKGDRVRVSLKPNGEFSKILVQIGA